MQKNLNKSWKRAGAFLAVVLLFGALEWVSLNVWTAPIGMVWHLFHGSFTPFDGHKIHVPWDMWVSNSADHSVVIIRPASKHPVLRSPAGVMLIDRSRRPVTDLSKNYERFARTLEHPLDGHQFLGVHRLSTPTGYGYCWEQSKFDFSELYITCVFEKDTLGGSYVGSSAYRKDFYAAIEAASGAF